MQSLYPAVKHSHIFFISISIILFNLRFWWGTISPQSKQPAILRIIPHINDSLILFSGMLLLQIIPWQPFGVHKWLGIKFGLIILYIICGIFCLKSQPKTAKRFILYFLSLLSVAIVVYLAKFKPSI